MEINKYSVLRVFLCLCSKLVTVTERGDWGVEFTREELM